MSSERAYPRQHTRRSYGSRGDQARRAQACREGGSEAEQGALDRGEVEQGALDRGEVHQGEVCQGEVYQGAAEQSAVEQGVLEQAPR